MGAVIEKILDIIGPPLKLAFYIGVVLGAFFLFFSFSPDFRVQVINFIDKYLPFISNFFK